jgi:hypothetical protein
MARQGLEAGTGNRRHFREKRALLISVAAILAPWDLEGNAANREQLLFRGHRCLSAIAFREDLTQFWSALPMLESAYAVASRSNCGPR